jgi:hypothetical protein
LYAYCDRASIGIAADWLKAGERQWQLLDSNV